MPGVGTLYFLAIRKQGGEDRYTIYRPNTGRSVSDKMGWDLKRQYCALEPSEADKGWTRTFEQTATRCVHGGKCSCSTGTRQSYVGILSSSVVPLWQQLLEALAWASSGPPLADRQRRPLQAELERVEEDVGDEDTAGIG
jgi:hypothetical protein